MNRLRQISNSAYLNFFEVCPGYLLISRSRERECRVLFVNNFYYGNTRKF